MDSTRSFNCDYFISLLYNLETSTEKALDEFWIWTVLGNQGLVAHWKALLFPTEQVHFHFIVSVQCMKCRLSCSETLLTV